MSRAFFGMFKGLFVGLLASLAVWKLPILSEWTILSYLLCAVTGALVGVICGTPPWKTETFWTPLLKALFGMAFGIGFCALGRYLIPQISMQPLEISAMHLAVPFFSPLVLAPSLGLVYGMLIELDDASK